MKPIPASVDPFGADPHGPAAGPRALRAVGPSPRETPEEVAERARQLSRLRSEITRMQRPRGDSGLLPLAPELAALLPGGGLRVGAAYSLSPSAALLGALLAPPSRQGAWCAIVGMPALGVEALAGLGVELSRVVLIPEPGERWLGVAAALAEVFPLLALHPPRTAAEGEVARLHARLRVQRSTMLVTAPWPQSDARLCLQEGEWQGLGAGWGLLSQRAVTVRAELPQGVRRVRVLLPGPAGTLAAADRQTTGGATEAASPPGVEQGLPMRERPGRARLRPLPSPGTTAPAAPDRIRVAG